jgi:hypothetical protein
MKNKIISKIKSALFLTISKPIVFRQKQNTKCQPTFINPFDILAEEQRKARQQADSYRFFIKAGFVSAEESKRLYKWFDDDWEIRDKDGKTRIRLLRKLSDNEVTEVINPKKLRFQPTRLVCEIQKRMPESEANL